MTTRIMDDEDSRSAKRGAGVRWGWFVFLLLLAGGVAVAGLVAPYFRQVRTVKITLTDVAWSAASGENVVEHDTTIAVTRLGRQGCFAWESQKEVGLL